MNILAFKRNCAGGFAALCLLTTGAVSASDTDPALAGVEETLLVHDIIVSHDPLAETELVSDDIAVTVPYETEGDESEFLKDPILAVSEDVELDIEFVEETPLPIIREISELNGLPLKRFKDNKDGCTYFGVGLDGTVGLHANF